MSTTSTESPMHLGKKIERIRELRGMKQDTLAAALGVSQQTISKMEASEYIDDDRLQKVAEVLGVTPEGLRNFNEDAIFNNINNNFHDNASLINYQFNPIDKIVELYERLLKSQQEKIDMLQSNAKS